MDVDTAVRLIIDTFNGTEVTNMVTEAQCKFFDKLLEEKDFGDKDLQLLKAQFAALNKKSGSAWIEAAMALPKRDETDETVTPPAF